MMEDLIKTIAKALVDFPEDVEVEVQEDAHKVVYLLKCNPADLGKIIGKQGRVAKAIRTVVYAAGASGGKKVYLEIVE